MTSSSNLARRLLAAKIWNDMRAKDAIDSVFSSFRFSHDEAFRRNLHAKMLGGFEVVGESA